MKLRIRLINAFVILASVFGSNLYAASFPKEGYTDTNYSNMYQENYVEATNQDMLGTKYFYDTDFTKVGDYGTNPIYQLTSGATLDVTDQLDIGGTLYNLGIFGATNYFYIDGTDPAALGSTEPLFENPVPINQNYYFLLALALLYGTFISLKKKNA